MSEILIKNMEFPKKKAITITILPTGEVRRIPRKYDQSETVMLTDSKAVELPLQGNWHTGTPTEEGWYLLKVRHEEGIVYYANRWAKIIDYEWVYAMYGEIIGWQRIEEGE